MHELIHRGSKQSGYRLLLSGGCIKVTSKHMEYRGFVNLIHIPRYTFASCTKLDTIIINLALSI